MGSIATADLFNRLVLAFPANKEWERPRIIVDNRCNMPSRVRAILYNERIDELVKSLSKSVEMMINNDCDYVVVACNTSHVFIKKILEINKSYSDKILNIIELCAKRMYIDKVTNIKLLASEGTILSKVYDNELKKYDISIEDLDNNDFSRFRNWIEAVKQNKITNKIQKDFINYINNSNSDNIVLGCTELPILYRNCKDFINKQVYDPLQCVIDYLVEKQLSL